MGTGARTTWRRTLDIVGTALCVGTLVGTFLVVLAASASVDVRQAAVSSVAMLEPGTTSETGLRDLPILLPGGPVERSFPGGVGLDDRARVEQVAHGIARNLGFGWYVVTLMRTGIKPINDKHSLDLYHGYPYTYPELDDLVDYLVSPGPVRAHPEQFVELASLLLLSAVEDPARDDSDNTNSHAALAYSLLRRARDIQNTCDIQLELTFTVAMGYAPHIDDVESEVATAREMCPDDPTPLWLLGQLQTVQATRNQPFFDYAMDPVELERAANETFATLRREFPASPLGWAGAADLRLKQADEGDDLGVQRFENRIRRREALGFYEQARARSDDPTLLAGYGWALSGLGRDDEAVYALTRVHELYPEDPAYIALLVQALQRAGRPGDVVPVLAPLLTQGPAPRTSLRLTPMTLEVVEAELTSYGARDSLPGYAFDSTQQYTAGSDVTDTGFIPASNWTWTSLWCWQADLMGAQIQTGKAAEAYDDYRTGLGMTVASCPYETPSVVDRLAAAAAFATDDAALRQQAVDAEVKRETSYGYGPDADEMRSDMWDYLSDFWRSVADWRRARDTVAQWQTDIPDDPWTWHRLGEIGVLTGDDEQAVTAYQRAAAGFRTGQGPGGEHAIPVENSGSDNGKLRTQLELGVALEAAGRPDDARAAYERARDGARALDAYQSSDIEQEAESQLGGMALEDGDYAGAVGYYEVAMAPIYDYDPIPVPGTYVPKWYGLGSQDNNMALALVKQGKDKPALAHAEAALARDLANPVYVDTVAFVQQLSGDDDAAIETYQRVMETDPTAYVSANNLAVLLAQHGRRAQAVRLLEQAVAVAPTYAIGWHNLGVLREPVSTSLLSSQGALARAARLDRGFRGQDGLVVDDEIYRSGLDVSRPLSPDWEYASSATSVPRALTLGALALLLLRLVWVLGLDRLTGTVSEKVIKASAKPGRLRWFWRRLGGPVAVVASLVVLSWPLVTAAHSPLELLVLGAAAIAMVLLPLFVRRLLAGERRVSHFAWVPALVVGAAGVPLGVAFAPYPSLDAPTPSTDSPASPADTRLRWLVPAAVTPVAATFTLLAALDPVPIARLLALSAIALLASVLTPVPPLDGAYLEHRLLGLGVTVFFTFTTVAFALQWI